VTEIRPDVVDALAAADDFFDVVELSVKLQPTDTESLLSARRRAERLAGRRPLARHLSAVPSND
jgi:hypothetical protein